MFDPIEKKQLQKDWRPGPPKDIGIWQVLLEDTIFGSRVHTASMKGWSTKGKDLIIVAGCAHWNVPKILASRRIPSIYIEDAQEPSATATQ